MKRRDIIIGLLAALFLAALISPFASGFPDGLERIAENLGFLEKGAVEPAVGSLIPDYSLPGVKNGLLAGSLAGVTGTLLVFLAGYGLAKLLRKLR